MRANSRDKEDLVSRIEDLLVLLGDHLKQIALALQSTAQSKRSRTQMEVGREIREPNILRQRIISLVAYAPLCHSNELLFEDRAEELKKLRIRRPW